MLSGNYFCRMKPLRNKLLSVSLCLLILAGSGGGVFYTVHRCHSHHDTYFALYSHIGSCSHETRCCIPQDACCALTGTVNYLRFHSPDCCTDYNVLLSLSAFHSSQQENQAPLPVIVFLQSSVMIMSLQSQFQIPVHLESWSPPPLLRGGKSSLLCVFRT